MKAIFVDGVGRTKAVEIPDAYPTYRWPIPLERRIGPIRHMTRQAARKQASSLSEYAVASFERIGRLADGRLVYAQREAKLSLWRIAITDQEIRAAKDVDIVEQKVNKFLRRHGQPAIVLARTDDRTTGLLTVEGVARQIAKA